MLLSLPQLEALDLGNNPIGDVGLDQLSVALEECRQLTYLNLSKIAITPQSIFTISRLLRRLDKLQILVISQSWYLGSSEDMKLCKAVEKHPSLKRLFVPPTLTDDTIRRLESLKSDPTCALAETFYW